MLAKQFAPVDLKFADTEGAFVATFARLNVIDRDGDVTVPGAFKSGQRVKIAQWGHNWGALPVGDGVIAADDEKAWVDGQFFLDTAAGRDTYTTVKRLADLQEWSYGFDIKDQSFGEFDGQDVRFLRSLDVFEVSPVMVGAGIGTRTDAIKSRDGLPYAEYIALVAADAERLLERTRERVDFRAKEGRTLSTANRNRLKGHRDTLMGIISDLDEILAATDPNRDDEKAARLLAARQQLVRLNALRLDIDLSTEGATP
jgi:HK97 family phage prohead protease